MTKSINFCLHPQYLLSLNVSKFQDKFPDAAKMIKTLKDEYKFRVTLWIHPFINLECPSWFTAATPPQSYMVRDTKGKQEIGRLPGKQ